VATFSHTVQDGRQQDDGKRNGRIKDAMEVGRRK
jgi:hypothetical protein